MGQRKKVAIACQGGGSQTAFTAGVLKSFFKNEVHKKHDIVSLSGTSGGAICATLAWYGLLKSAQGDQTPVEARLEAFWRANSAQNIVEGMLNAGLVKYAQLVGEGLMPEWNISPVSPINQAAFSVVRATFPRFLDFKSLLEEHIDFGEIQNLVTPSSPVLLLGAANVLSGEFKKFSSLKNEIEADALLASAAVPSIFPPVQIGEAFYWDGLLSDNPPTDELIESDYVGNDRKPDELWVIQINPRTCRKMPETAEQILDRRNEMIENESLFQDLEHIMMVNRFLERGAFTQAYIDQYQLKKIDLFTINMSESLVETLDYSSKLNRSSTFINGLIKDGERQGNLFLKHPERMIYEG